MVDIWIIRLGRWAVRAINEKLKSTGNEPVEFLEVKFRPDESEMAKCYAMGQKIASMVKSA